MDHRPRGQRRMALVVFVLIVLLGLAVATPVAITIEATLEMLQAPFD